MVAPFLIITMMIYEISLVMLFWEFEYKDFLLEDTRGGNYRR